MKLITSNVTLFSLEYENPLPFVKCLLREGSEERKSSNGESQKFSNKTNINLAGARLGISNSQLQLIRICIEDQGPASHWRLSGGLPIEFPLSIDSIDCR